MKLYLRSASVCLVVLLAWNGTAIQGKTADEIADDHACTYFRATDANRDKISTVLDYVFEWLTVPFSGSKANPVIDVKRQVDILQQYINVFPLTDTNILQSLLRGGVKLNGFRQTMKEKREEKANLLESQVDDMVTFLMKVFNYDGDEQSFTQNELEILWKVVRLEDASTTFAKINRDGDDKITHGEYYLAGIDFFNGEEDGHCEWFAGPPKTCDEVQAEQQKWIDIIATGSVSLPLPVGESIGDVKVLTDLLGNSPAVQDLLKKLFTDYLGTIPAALGSLVGIVSSLLGSLVPIG